ncbi:hypothetical protein [Saccharomonospora saliphila]|nr:hypothetical protein [Saccharomonospora saliphila]
MAKPLGDTDRVRVPRTTQEVRRVTLPKPHGDTDRVRVPRTTQEV